MYLNRSDMSNVVNTEYLKIYINDEEFKKDMVTSYKSAIMAKWKLTNEDYNLLYVIINKKDTPSYAYVSDTEVHKKVADTSQKQKEKGKSKVGRNILITVLVIISLLFMYSVYDASHGYDEEIETAQDKALIKEGAKYKAIWNYEE